MYRKVKSLKEIEMYQPPKPAKQQRAVTSVLSPQERAMQGFLSKRPDSWGRDLVLSPQPHFWDYKIITTFLPSLFSIQTLPQTSPHSFELVDLLFTNCYSMHISINIYFSKYNLPSLWNVARVCFQGRSLGTRRLSGVLFPERRPYVSCSSLSSLV